MTRRARNKTSVGRPQVAPLDGVLLSLTLAALVFGWVVLYSASALMAEARFGDQYYFVKKQILWSVLGLIGTHSAEHAPVTDRCGSTCTRFIPRTRAFAWRQTPPTPPEASMLEPQEIR